MADINSLLDKHKDHNIALYGLGTETERFLYAHSSHLSIIGLLDGFKESGEIYGYPIIPLSTSVSRGVSLIIVIARPGSCKAIAKRIGDFCKEHSITLFDVRGRDLLASTSVSYEFCSTAGGNIESSFGRSRRGLMDAIEDADIISFDLFDTLVMRKTMSYTDVFELLNLRLQECGIYIPDFAKLRLYAEKELSKTSAPRLEAIYECVLGLAGGNFISPSELAEMEWELDYSLLTVRSDVRDVFSSALEAGKKVVITTDSYYSKEQIERVLNRFDLTGFDDIFVSCEYGTGKAQELFDVVKQTYPNQSILHIGDDEYADIEKAKEHGISALRLFSAADLLDALGGLGLEQADSISDRVKIGLFLSRIFNSPFWFNKPTQPLSVKSASDIGFLFCAPMITDFIIWMKEQTTAQSFHHILFGARDGYLVGRLFRMIDEGETNDGVAIKSRSFYFLTSRTAAIRAGMELEADIEYVDSMKFFGSPEGALKVRFGIDVEDASIIDRTAMILEKSQKQRENYKSYIDKLGIGREDDEQSGQLALFDFVAKGTTQMYLSRLFKNQHLKGFYFLQLEPEFMADKGLDIEPFYSDEEKNTSAIFDNYYILETMLTSPYPQMLEMDEDGKPVFAEETRSEIDINVFKRAQDGIEQYFREYCAIVPKNSRTVNKALDEKMLELVNKVKILDEEFLAIKVEDPFFGRMTDIKDVIG